MDTAVRLNRRGMTIAIITHDRGIADHLARQIEMVDGRIIADTDRERR